MRDPLVRTKVVIRHLPPTLSQSALFEQIDGRFAGRYQWFSFRPGKNSQKHQKYSRAYIDFRRPEDVVEFAEFFDGHVFVNEKGTQVKAMVEYAPSQRVPESWCKKDGREGTILKDAKYLEFLELLAKPVENLPSAEIQLEKREAERVGAGKEPPVITPLMDFVRQKRAAKGGTQRLLSNGKLTRRAMAASPGNSRSTSSKQGSEKRRASTSVYVKRDSTKGSSGKEKTYILASDKSNTPNTEAAADVIMDESGASGAVDLGKKKVLLLKGKEREISHSATSVRNSACSPAFRNSQRREVGGGVIRSILSNKEARQSQSSKVAHSEPQIQTSEKEKKPPRSTNNPSILKNHLSPFSAAACNSDSDFKRTADIGSEPQLQGSGSINEKQDKRTKNKDRFDRVWSHYRSNGSHGSDETLSLSESLEGISIAQQSQATGVGKRETTTDSAGKHRSFMSSQLDIRSDVPNSTRNPEIRTVGSIRSVSSLENGSHRHGRRGSAHMKDVDGSSYVSEGKPPKRGGATGYGPHEKQVWVQKSGSGS